MRLSLPDLLARSAHALPRVGTRRRVTALALFVLALVLALTGQQALRVAQRDADAALRVQVSSQLAALSQASAGPVVRRDYRALQDALRAAVARGGLRYAEYTSPEGHVLRQGAPSRAAERPEWFARAMGLAVPDMHEPLLVAGAYHGSLLVEPSSQPYEDFLWRLGIRLLLVLGAAFVLLGWLTQVLLATGLKALTPLRRAARRVEAGDYGARLAIQPGAPRELRETVGAFNAMSAALERKLTDLAERQKALDSAAGVSESDLAGHITSANDLFCIISGYTHAELVGQNHALIKSGMHDAQFFAELWETISQGRTWRGEICNRAKNGRLFWTATTIIPIKGEDGRPVKYLSVHFDITQRKLDEAALSNEKQRWQVTLQSINDAVVVTNPHNQVTYLNPTAESLLGISLEDATLNSLNDVMRLDQINGEEDAPACFLPSLRAPHGQVGSAQLHNRLGQYHAISYSCAPLSDKGGVGAVYVLRDETEKKELLDSLRDMAFHDTLTTLPNRRAVEGRLDRALRTARERGQQHAFCYIDLDQFKLVNDTCGHAVGDTLLMDIAQTMKAALPERAYLGRLGGDEFGLILFDARPDEASAVCRQVVQRIREFRFEHKGRRFALGACAGIAPITQAATTAGEIMIQADMACYRAKSEGSGRVLLYEADEVGFRRLEAEMGWAADFAQALEANQFLPYRQLIQPTADGQPHYEVLIRWQRNGMIEGPAKLLPALERYGQAPILDRWMLEAVISYLSAHPDDNAVYFINLSGKTVADESFLGIVCQLLDHYGVVGSRLGFEVTETAAVVNLEDAQRLIHGLRGRGCRFALDDFGRDASSFFYLKHLPADFLKIDGAFVRGMLEDSRDQAIVRSIAQLARDFGMHSVAEQVEDAEMAALLGTIGVDYLQGYHIHRPEPFPHWGDVAATTSTPRPSHLTLIR